MNQPPQLDKQTDKRIVSKCRYMRVLGIRVGLDLTALLVTVVLALAGLVTVCLLIAVVYLLSSLKIYSDASIVIFICIILGVLLGGITYLLGRLLHTICRHTHTYAAIVPLTRANAADLPAPESLVRASTEPMQEQQAVLLRAATETQERHEDQLVRASAGGMEQA